MSGGVSGLGGSVNGSSNKGWSTQSGSYTGQSEGQSSGHSSGESAGQSGGITSNTSNPIISDDWLRRYGGLGNALGTTGVTAAQQGNIDALRGVAAGQGNYTQAGYYGLGDLAQRFGGQWAMPDAVSAPTVTAPSVTAQTGASFMAPYQQGYTNDVVDATLANYDRNTDRQLSARRSARDASGAFGDRASLADGQFLSDSDMNRAQTEAALRDQGFTRGATFGFQDAVNALQASGMNAGNALQASGMNAANALAAQQFNDNLIDSRQKYDVQTGFQGDANRMQAFRDLQNNALAQSGIQSGGVNNLMGLLGIGQSTFGQQQDGTNSSTSSNTSSSDFLNTFSNTASGTSQSQSNSGSKSKGGSVGTGSK